VNLIIEKPKLRKGLSYVQKSSIIGDVISAGKIDVPVYLTFFIPQHFNPTDTSVFEAEFVPVSIGGRESRFHIRIGVVVSADRKQVGQLFLENVLKPFSDFMQYQLSKPANSTDHGRGFYVRWVGRQLIY
jgi:hypothetical protein